VVHADARDSNPIQKIGIEPRTRRANQSNPVGLTLVKAVAYGLRLRVVDMKELSDTKRH
jgi:hypothetical protein